MRYLRLVVIGALLGLGLSTIIKVYSTFPLACAAVYRFDTTVNVGKSLLTAEIANNDAQRTKGLSGRQCIGANQAMLFVFDRPDYYPFWMKDMNFPIDIIWIDANHHVVTVKSNVNPSTYPQSFVNSNPAQYVIEIKAGRAQALGITNGTLIKFNQ